MQGEQLALLALKRMARDKNNEVRLQYSTELEDNAGVDTFIATAISPTQRVSECYTLLEESSISAGKFSFHKPGWPKYLFSMILCRKQIFC